MHHLDDVLIAAADKVAKTISEPILKEVESKELVVIPSSA